MMGIRNLVASAVTSVKNIVLRSFAAKSGKVDWSSVGKELPWSSESEQPSASSKSSPSKPRKASQKKTLLNNHVRRYTQGLETLVVGDGNMSLSVCFAERFSDTRNLTATTFNGYGKLLSLYQDAGINIDKLRRLNATVIHNVDARSLTEDVRLKNQRYHRIVFFFPHAGFFPGWSETELRMIQEHRKLLSQFLQQAAKMLHPGGEIHITNKSTPPFSDWGIEQMADRAGLKLLRETKFNPKNFPGYTNKRGSGKTPDKWFKMGQCSTYEFGLK